jgi:hypothetical protein
MPQPEYGQVHVNVPLTNISVAYQQDATNFIADQIFPMVPVDKQGNLYYEYLLEDWIRITAEERAPGTESAGGGWDLTNHPYFCRLFSIHKDIDDQTAQNADSAFNLDRDATQWVTHQLLLKREVDFINNFLSPGIWGLDYSSSTTPGALAWDNVNASPITDVLTAKLKIGQLTGYQPNVLALGPVTFMRLLNSPEIINRVKFSGSGFPTAAVLSQAFGVDKIVVGNAIYNPAPKGAAMTPQYVWGTSALLAYAAPAPGLLQPSAGYIFTWDGLLGAGAYGTRIKRFRMENIESNRLEGESAYDMHKVGANLGAYWSDIVTAPS